MLLICISALLLALKYEDFLYYLLVIMSITSVVGLTIMFLFDCGNCLSNARHKTFEYDHMDTGNKLLRAIIEGKCVHCGEMDQ